jgi:hypothetical protein
MALIMTEMKMQSAYMHIKTRQKNNYTQKNKNVNNNVQYKYKII